MIGPFATIRWSTVSAICSEAIKFVTHKKDQIDMYQNGIMEEEKTTNGTSL
jgi:hypothetical protein